MPKRRLILASGSPRRCELLRRAGYVFDVIVPSERAECGICSGESPPELVVRLAHQKAQDVARQIDSGIVIGCDTVAECLGQILGKPQDAYHARRMLTLLRGRVHRVYSGICLLFRPEDEVLLECERTQLRMDMISNQQLDEYLASQQWQGKAGAFGYQDGLDWVHLEEGSESNVVGLPLERLAAMLSRLSDGNAAGESAVI
jgi:septum formation protein